MFCIHLVTDAVKMVLLLEFDRLKLHAKRSFLCHLLRITERIDTGVVDKNSGTTPEMGAQMHTRKALWAVEPLSLWRAMRDVRCVRWPPST